MNQKTNLKQLFDDVHEALQKINAFNYVGQSLKRKASDTDNASYTAENKKPVVGQVHNIHSAGTYIVSGSGNGRFSYVAKDDNDTTLYSGYLDDTAESEELHLTIGDKVILNASTSTTLTVKITQKGTLFNFMAKSFNDFKRDMKSLSTRLSEAVKHFDEETEAIPQVVETQVNELLSEQYVTPEMFGAVGDGVTDDTQAIKDCFAVGVKVCMGVNKTYLVHENLVLKAYTIIGNGSTLMYRDKDTTEKERISFMRTDEKYLYLYDLTVDFQSDYMYRKDNKSFYLIYGIYTETTIFENVVLLIGETTNDYCYHIHTCTSFKSIFKNCTFTNLTKGICGGALWVDLQETEEKVGTSLVENCIFENFSTDETIAYYGSKNIVTIKNCLVKCHKFRSDKTSIHISFYNFPHRVTIDNCEIIYEDEENTGVFSIIRAREGTELVIKNTKISAISNLFDIDSNSNMTIENSQLDCGLNIFFNGSKGCKPKKITVKNSSINCFQVVDFINNSKINCFECNINTYNINGTLKHPFKNREGTSTILVKNCTIDAEESYKTRLLSLLNTGEVNVFIKDNFVNGVFYDAFTTLDSTKTDSTETT